MMKRLLLMFVGLLVIGLLQAQTGWIEKNANIAATKGVGQLSVGMLDQNAIWGLVINADGSIFDGFTKSIDAGQNWFPGTFNAGDGLSQLFAIDATTCWALFNTGPTQGLYKTVNGGTTWTKKGTAFGASSFADIMHFFNEDDGVAMGDPVGGYFEIYTTTDGGETWTRVPSANIPTPVSGEYGITANYDVVGDHIWFGTNKGRIFHSADKGLTWTATLTNFGAAEVVQPEFASETYGICFRSYLNIGLETAIGITTDGGATWNTVTVTGPMYARYFSYIPGTEMTFVGSSGEAGANGISYSTDGGYTWAAITEGYSFLATVWLDNATGWAGSFAVADRTSGGMYIYDGPPLEPFAVPTLSLSTDLIEAQAEAGATFTDNLTVSNIGDATLDYTINVIYAAPGKKSAAVSLEGNAGKVASLGYTGDVSVDPNGRPAAYNPPPTDDFVLHYDGDNENAIGWNNAPVSPMVAAMFPTNLTLAHAGMMLSSVDLYIRDPGTNYILKIWDMGNSNSPGEVLVSQAFAGAELSWNNVELADPVYITGSDIWVGYQFTQPDTGLYIPGVDGGPNNINGNWLSTGVSWSRLSDGNPELTVNWNIRANLTGTPLNQWLSVAPASGTIEPGESDNLVVTCDATGMEPGMYYAYLRFVSNDPNNGIYDLPVTFEVLPGGTMQSVVLDFEDQADWDITFDPWTAVDVDGGATYPITDVTFPHSGEPLAYIAFNPASTTPPITDPEMEPHGGVRFGACMATIPDPFNDDWMISPQIDLGMNSSVTMWVKSYTDEYGLEKYNVLVSTTDMDPGSFTSISGPTPMLAPVDWTEVSYDLSAYDNQTVYVAIQCVSEDAFIFMLDDVSIDFVLGTPEQEQEVAFNIYPNPVNDQLNITSDEEMTQVDIFNQLGQRVFSQVVKNTYFNLKTSEFNSGVYYVRVTSDNGVATEKIMVR
jgi:photosystem II stability/assembly factor-like uncharacterized protein